MFYAHLAGLLSLFSFLYPVRSWQKKQKKAPSLIFRSHKTLSTFSQVSSCGKRHFCKCLFRITLCYLQKPKLNSPKLCYLYFMVRMKWAVAVDSENLLLVEKSILVCSISGALRWGYSSMEWLFLDTHSRDTFLVSIILYIFTSVPVSAVYNIAS